MGSSSDGRARYILLLPYSVILHSMKDEEKGALLCVVFIIVIVIVFKQIFKDDKRISNVVDLRGVTTDINLLKSYMDKLDQRQTNIESIQVIDNQRISNLENHISDGISK